MTAGQEFDESGQKRPLSLLCIGTRMIDADLRQQTGLSTFSNSLINVARCPRDVTGRARVNFLVGWGAMGGGVIVRG